MEYNTINTYQNNIPNVAHVLGSAANDAIGRGSLHGDADNLMLTSNVGGYTSSYQGNINLVEPYRE